MSKLSEYSKFDHLIDDDDDDDDAIADVMVADPSSTVGSETTSLRSSSNDKNVIRHVRKYPITTTATTTTNNAPGGNIRFLVQYQDHTVYEWEQSLNEVIIYILSPIQNNNKKNNNEAKIFCHISATHLQVGIQQPTSSSSSTSSSDMKHYYIDEDIYHSIDTKESTWCIEQEDIVDTGTGSSNQPPPQQRDVITIYLQKVAKGLVWEAALRGRFHTTLGNSTNSDNNHHHHHAILDPMSLQDVQKSLLLERWQEENPGMDFRDATFNGSTIPDPRTYMGGIGYQ